MAIGATSPSGLVPAGGTRAPAPDAEDFAHCRLQAIIGENQST
jgi:hypothetical protein